MNKYYKNFILCGDVDYHCLLCCENFQSLEYLEKHIRWEKHRKIMKEQTYYRKCKKDLVYKIGDTFYCEACNCLIQSLPEVTSHVSIDAHKVNIKSPISDKTSDISCEYNCGYVIISDIIVSEKQWHCIVNKSCLLCEKDVQNYTDHIGTTAHVMNIIKAKVTRKEDNYYREINERMIYCFICKKPIASVAIDAHWSEQTHCELKNTAIGRVTLNSQATEEEKKKELASRLVDTQRPYFEINSAKKNAKCRTCKVEVMLNFKDMLNHHKSHGDNAIKEIIPDEGGDESDEEELDNVIYCAIQDHGKLRSELSKYGKENYMKLNAGGSKGYCGLCDVSLSASIKVFKEHTRGACHSGHLELKGLKSKKDHKKPNIKRAPLTKYLGDLYHSRSAGMLLVNQEICIDVRGFMFTKVIDMDKNYQKIKCFVCNVVLSTDAEVNHYRTEDHKRRFLAAKTFDMPGELVREIRPDLFHCATCSKVFPFWELLENHVKSFSVPYFFLQIRPDLFHCATCSKVFPFWELLENHVKSLNHLMQKKYNSDLGEELLDQWYIDNVLVKTSTNLDVLYVQLKGLGIFQ